MLEECMEMLGLNGQIPPWKVDCCEKMLCMNR